MRSKAWEQLARGETVDLSEKCISVSLRQGYRRVEEKTSTDCMAEQVGQVWTLAHHRVSMRVQVWKMDRLASGKVNLGGGEKETCHIQWAGGLVSEAFILFFRLQRHASA